jgi:hypothetical protein
MTRSSSSSGPESEQETAELALPRHQRWALGRFVRRFPYVHLGIGLGGNGLFIVGAVLYAAGRDGLGVWFFIAGSCGMFAGSLGELLRALGRRRLARFDVDPAHPDERWSQVQSRASSLD